MYLSDKQLTELTDDNICPVCRGITKLSEVISHFDNKTGYLCSICEYISVPVIRRSFDRYMVPGIFFDTVH